MYRKNKNKNQANCFCFNTTAYCPVLCLTLLYSLYYTNSLFFHYSGFVWL